jgi:hypothetical protein
MIKKTTLQQTNKQTNKQTISDWPDEILQNEDSAVFTAPDGEVLYRGLRVRIGIHFGTSLEEMDPISKRTTYYGREINTAVQLEKISHGGQVIFTSVSLLPSHTKISIQNQPKPKTKKPKPKKPKKTKTNKTKTGVNFGRA